MTAPVALAGCGGTKAAARCRADQMYTGSYSRKCWQAAQVLCPGRAFFISARHGLLLPGTEIDPYEQRQDKPGAVDAACVRRQAAELGIIAAPVIVLAGQAYANLAYEVWAEVVTPLDGLFIGQQLHALMLIAARGTLDRAGA